MNTRNKILFVPLVVALIAGCTNNQDPLLAEVNGSKIHATEFIQRYRKYLESTSERDNIVVRKKVLNNMMNEILILQDAKARGNDSDQVFRERYEDITNQALLDGYGKKLAREAMTVSEPELLKEFRAYNTKVSARFVYADTKEEAINLKKRLQNGETFANIAREVFEDPDLAANGGYLGFFGWGEMERPLEEAAYSLPVDVLSDPIRMKAGYGIVKVEKRVEVPLASEHDFAKKKPVLEKAIRQSKIIRSLTNEADDIERELSPQFNEDAVKSLLESWDDVNKTWRAEVLIESNKEAIPNWADMSFVGFNQETWTVGQFVEKLAKTRERHRNRVKTTEHIKEIALGLAIRSTLLQKALEAGLNRDADVQSQIREVSEDFILRRWARSVEDTVGTAGWDDTILRKEFDANRDLYATPLLLNTSEVLVRSEDQAMTLLNSVKKGTDFGSLAKKHSIRRWAAQHGGELGFVPISTFGDIGPHIMPAKVGDVVGPFFVKPYFALYKILGIKQSRRRAFEEARDDVIQTLLPSRKKQAFSDALDGLRSNSKSIMDVVALGNVVVTPP